MFEPTRRIRRSIWTVFPSRIALDTSCAVVQPDRELPQPDGYTVIGFRPNGPLSTSHVGVPDAVRPRTYSRLPSRSREIGRASRRERASISAADPTTSHNDS